MIKRCFDEEEESARAKVFYRRLEVEKCRDLDAAQQRQNGPIWQAASASRAAESRAISRS